VEREEHGLAGSAGPPRSLFITNDFPPRVGGFQSYYWGLIQTLSPDDVVIMAPAYAGAADFDSSIPYRVHRVATSVVWPTRRHLRKALEIIEQFRPELIQMGHPLPAGLLAPVLSKRTGLPYLVFLGGSELTVPAVIPGVAAATRHVIGQASLLISVSDFTTNAARRYTGGRVACATLRPCIDVDRFAVPGTAEKAAAKKALGIQGPLVVCVGRLVPRKGQDRLVDAVGLLADRFPDLHLGIVGDGRLHGRLRRKAARHGIAERVHLAGEVQDEALRTWLRAADVFASPCRVRWGGLEVEGFGLVFSEAALMGLPVLAGRSGGAIEAVKTGETGLAVCGSCAEEVAAGLCRLLSLSDARRQAFGEAGRRLALSRHAREVAGRRYRSLLRLVTEERG
jgi:phosphatidylinositol alpha-1,6-mannosyltransferase